MLEGKRVILRPIDKKDVELFLKWFNDPEVTQYLLFYLPMTRKAEEKWIEDNNLSNSNFIFLIEIKGDKGRPNIPIGNCGLHQISWKDRHATFGIAIGEKDYWNNGYGSETSALLLKYGFEVLNLHRISSSVFEFNKRSLKAHQKVGFQIEGRRRKVFFKRNRYCDEIILGLLKSEWSKRK